MVYGKPRSSYKGWYGWYGPKWTKTDRLRGVNANTPYFERICTWYEQWASTGRTYRTEKLNVNAHNS